MCQCRMNWPEGWEMQVREPYRLLTISTRKIKHLPINNSISFEAFSLWLGLKSENGEFLGSPSGTDRSGMLFNLLMRIVLSPGNRF